METFKTIIAGTLDFGKASSFESAKTLFLQRAETHFRNAVIVKDEELFVEEREALVIPRTITEISQKKNWSNTINLLQFIAQYAIAGQIDAWCIKDKKLLHHEVIEPTGDKTVIRSFKKGRELLVENGNEEAARKALSKAIDKFERHAMAYERRGHINFRLSNLEDAIYDLSKSIKIWENAPAYQGRGTCYFTKGDYESAFADFQRAHQLSIPHQPIFWKAYRLKAECLFRLKKYEDAAKAYKFVTGRQYEDKDPNKKWLKMAFTNYATSLRELGQHAEADKAFTKAVEAAALEDQTPNPPEGQIYFLRGKMRKDVGLKGYESDLKAALKAGIKEAAEVL